MGDAGNSSMEEEGTGWQLSYSHLAPPEPCPTGVGQRGAKLQLTGFLLGWRDGLGFTRACPSAHQTLAPLSTNPHLGSQSTAPRSAARPGGDAHRGWGGCPATPAGEADMEAELVLDGISELVHDPLTGGSGGVLWRREPVWAGPKWVCPQGWGSRPVMHRRVQPQGFPQRVLPGSGKAKSGLPCSARWLSGGLPGGSRLFPAPRTLAIAPARPLGGEGQHQCWPSMSQPRSRGGSIADALWIQCMPSSSPLAWHPDAADPPVRGQFACTSPYLSPGRLARHAGSSLRQPRGS